MVNLSVTEVLSWTFFVFCVNMYKFAR